MNSRDRTLSPTPSCRLRYDPRNGQNVRPTIPELHELIASAKNVPDNERFELVPDEFEEDSIFSDSTSDDFDSKTTSNRHLDRNNEVIISVGENKQNESELKLPFSSTVPLQPRSECIQYTVNIPKLDVRRKFEEAALSEAMSGPGRSVRQSQAMALARHRNHQFHEVKSNVISSDTDEKDSIIDEGDICHTGINCKCPCPSVDHKYGSSFCKNRDIFEPPSIVSRRSFEKSTHNDNCRERSHRSSSLQPYHRSMASYVRTYHFTGDNGLSGQHDFFNQTDEIKNPTAHQPDKQSSSAQPSTHDVPTSPSSYSHMENKCSTLSPSSQNTAHTVETSSVDISSKDSSDSSEKCTNESKCDSQYNDALLLNEEMNEDPHPVPSSTDHNDESVLSGMNIQADRECTRRKSGGACTPRSVLLEKCGWTHHHRFARHRSDKLENSNKSVVIVPLHHMSSALLLNKEYIQDEILALEEKEVMLRELEELKAWKRDKSKALEEKESEIDELSQNAQKLIKEAEEMNSLRSQVSLLQTECEESKKTIEEQKTKIYELKEKMDRSESTALERFDKELNYKIDEIVSLKNDLQAKDDEIDKLKFQLQSFTGRNHILGEELEELRSLKVATEGSLEAQRSENLNLSKMNDAMRQEIEDLNINLERMMLFQEENSSLRVRLEFKTAYCDQLLNEISTFQNQLKITDTALAEARDEISSLRIRHESKVACCTTLTSQVLSYQDKLKVVEDRVAETLNDNDSLRLKVESKSAEILDLRKKLLEEKVDHNNGDLTQEDNLVNVVDDLKSWKRVAKETLDANSKEFLELSKVAEVTREEVGVWKDRYESKATECEKLLQENLTYQEELKVSQITVEEARDENSSLRDTMESKTAEIVKLQQDIVKITDDHNNTISSLENRIVKESALHLEAIQKHESEVAKNLSKLIVLEREIERKNAEVSSLHEELDSAESDLLTSVKEVEELEGLLTQCKTQVKLKELELSTKIVECEKMSTEIVMLQDRIQFVENQNSVLHLRLIESGNEVEETKRQLTHYKAAMESKEVEAQNRDAECEKMKADIREFEEKLQLAEEEQASLNVKIDDLEKEADRMDGFLLECKEIIKSKEDEVQSKNDEIEVMSTVIIDQKEKQLSVENDNACLRLRLESTEAKCESLSKESANCKESCEAYKSQLAKLEEEFSRQEIAIINHEIFQLKDENFSLSASVKDLEHEIVQYKEEISRKSEENQLILMDYEDSKEKSEWYQSKVNELEDIILLQEKVINANSNDVCALEGLLNVRDATIESLEMKVQNQSEEISDHQAVNSSLSGTVKYLDDELQECSRDLKLKSEYIESLELDATTRSKEISELQVEISSLTLNLQYMEDYLLECKEEHKQELIVERGPIMNRIEQLELIITGKEEEISLLKNELAGTFTEKSRIEAKLMSMSLLNESLTTERDDLRLWKHSMENEMQEKVDQIREMTSHLSFLQSRCEELEESLKEKETCINKLERKIETDLLALSRYEEDLLVKSKKLMIFEEKVMTKSNEIDEITLKIHKMNALHDSIVNEVEALKSWKEEATDNLKMKNKEITCLSAEREDLLSKIKDLSSRQEDLESQVLRINDEKIKLAKNSLHLASAFEEKIDVLQNSAERAAQLEKDLQQQKLKYDQAQNAIDGLQKALMAVEKQRQKLIRTSGSSVSSADP